MFISRLHIKIVVNIIVSFKDLTWISHMCGVIDSAHIKLAEKSKVVFVLGDY